MISSIIVIGSTVAVFIMMAAFLERFCKGHSIEYYRYLENNKVPPPEDRQDREILYGDLWGVRRR